MILRKDTWYYIIEQQKVLDEAFMTKAKWSPDARDRKTALRIEVCEFANEFPEQLKWWKHKENDIGRILDEYVDILHFIAGVVLDMGEQSTLSLTFGISSPRDRAFTKVLNRNHKSWKTLTTKYLLQELVKTKEVYTAVALATYILEREGFTDEDIREAYDLKNAKNFERIAAGY